MVIEPEPTENLFSYGTLQSERVQLATFGRKLDGTKDSLRGYELSFVKIEDPQVVATSGESHHPIIRFTDNPSHSVPGTLFEITRDELQQSDAYEVAAYKRVAVVLASGAKAWLYVDARDVNRSAKSYPQFPPPG